MNSKRHVKGKLGHVVQIAFSCRFYNCRWRIGNSMISSDIWRKYEKWYFKIAIRNLIEIRDNFDITRVGYAKDHVQIMLLFVYTSTRKSFLRWWNITALSQSNCRNFSCRSIIRNWNTVKCPLTAHLLSSGKWSQNKD